MYRDFAAWSQHKSYLLTCVCRRMKEQGLLFSLSEADLACGSLGQIYCPRPSCLVAAGKLQTQCLPPLSFLPCCSLSLPSLSSLWLHEHWAGWNLFLSGKIIGGHEVTPHSRPYMAYSVSKTSGRTSVCGGFLVSTNFVLTAAHCWGR